MAPVPTRKRGPILGSTGVAILAMVFGMIFSFRQAVAQALTWDGGTGTWSVQAGGWNDGVDETSWVNNPMIDVIFDGTAGTVTLGTPINVSNITFNAGTGNYLIAGGGNTLTLSNSTITLNTNASISAALGGSTGLATAGSGTLTLTGANTYTGGTSIGVGSTLQIGSGGTAGSLTGNVTDNGTLVFDLNENNAYAGYTYGGVISGSGGLTNSTYVLRLSAAQTYTGPTTVGSSAYLVLAPVDSALSASTVVTVSAGGSLDLNNHNQQFAGLEGGGTVYSSGGSSGNVTLSVPSGQTHEFSGALGSSTFPNFSFTMSGAGTQILTGASVYTGTTTISSGTLQIGDGGTAGSLTSNVLDNGTLAFDLNENNGYAGYTYSGVISGSGGLTNSIYVLRLSAAQTYTGPTTVGSGAYLVLAPVDSALSASTMVTVSAGGFLDLENHNQQFAGLEGGGTVYSYGGNSGSLTLSIPSGQTHEFSGVLGGNGFPNFALTLSGPGTEILSGSSVYTGTTTISSGTLQLGDGGATGSLQPTWTIVDNATLVFNRSDTPIQGADFGAITGSGGVIQKGSGTLIFTLLNDYTGGTSIGGSSTLQIGTGGPGVGISGNITNNGTLIFDISGIYTYNGMISGSGGLVISGGAVVLTAAQTYTGPTTVNTGAILQLPSTMDGGLSASTVVTLAPAGYIDLAGRNQTFAGLQGTPTGGGGVASSVSNTGILTLDVAAGQTYDFPGIIGASYPNFALVKDGPGTQILSGPNYYTGGTTINAGTLQIGDGGTSGFITGNVLNNGTLVVALNYEFAYDGVVSGNGGVTFEGGTVHISAAQTYTGPTKILSGTLVLPTTVSQGLSSSTVVTVTTGGNLDISGQDQQFAGLDGGGTVYSTNSTASTLTLNVASGQMHDFSGALGSSTAAAFALTVSGGGTQILSGNNIYSGGTTIGSGSTLQIGDGVASGSILGNVTDNGTLVFDRSDDYTFTGMISGNGGFTQAGLILRLSTQQKYTGPTQVNNGSYLVLPTTVSQGLSSSTVVNVATGGNLDLSAQNQQFAGLDGGGTVYTYNSTASKLTLNIASGQTHNFSGVVGWIYPNLSLTLSGAGTQILSGANTYTGGTDVSGGTLIVNNTSGSGTGTGAVMVESGASIQGTGIITGALTVLSGGNIQGGTATAPGILTASGGLNLNSGASATFILGLNGITSVNSEIVIGSGGALTVASGVSFNVTVNFIPVLNQTYQFDLLDWTTLNAPGITPGTDLASELNLPSLPNALWDTSKFDSQGILSLTVATPEPGRALLVMMGLMGVGLCRHRRGNTAEESSKA